MIINKVKIRRLFKKLFTAAVLLLLIYLGINLLAKLFEGIGTGTQEPTAKERREEKANTPTLGNTKIENNKIKDVAITIDTYYNYCNDKNYEKAYEMLSQECKEVLYPNLERFKERVDQVFDKYKLYQKQNEANYENAYIYRISLYDDIIAYGANEYPEKAYYYVTVHDNGEGKYAISLDGFVDRVELGYKINLDNVLIEVTSKDVYHNYTKLNYTITNNTDNVLAFNRDDVFLISELRSGIKETLDTTNVLGESIVHVLPHEEKEIMSSFKSINFYNTNKRVEFRKIYWLPAELINEKVVDQESGSTYEREREFTLDILKEKNIGTFDRQIPLEN